MRASLALALHLLPSVHLHPSPRYPRAYPSAFRTSQVRTSLAARSKRLLAAAGAAEGAGASTSRPSSGRGRSLLARAGLGRKARLAEDGGRIVGGAAGDGGGNGGVGAGGSSGGGGGIWEALDVVVKEAIQEAFAAADKEFIATSRLPEVRVWGTIGFRQKGRCLREGGGCRRLLLGGQYDANGHVPHPFTNDARLLQAHDL